MHVTIDVADASSNGQYLRSCARIRDISTTALLRMLVETIASEQLVLAVLDDDGRRPKRKFARRYSEPRSVTRAASAVEECGQE